MCGIIGIVGRQGYHINQLLYDGLTAVSYTHLRAHETEADVVFRLLLDKK